MSLGIYQDISFQDDNTASGRLLALADVGDIIRFPLISNGIALDSIQFVPGTSFVVIDLELYSLRLQISTKLSKGLKLYQHQITASIPKNRSQVLSALEDWLNKDLVLLYQSFNEDFRLLGNLDNPVRMTWDTDYGRSPEDENIHDIAFTWLNTDPAPYYDQEVDTANCGPVKILLDGEHYLTVPPGTTVDIPLNDIYKEFFVIENPSGLNKLVNEFEPITISRDLRIDSVTEKSADIELIEYSLNQVDWFALEPALPLNIPGGNLLYHRATLKEGTTSAQWKELGIYPS